MNTLYLLYELLAALRRIRWPAGRLVAYQGVRLRELVHHAYENVPYYRELFDKAGVRPADIRTPDDLRLLPVTTKVTLQSLPSEALLARNLDASAFVKELTSGSTGRPFTIWHTQRERIRKSALYMRMYLQVGLRVTDQQVCVTEERGQHAHRQWLKTLEALIGQGGQGHRRWPLSLIGGRSFVPVFDSVDSQIDQLVRLQPDFLLGFPSALRPIAEAVQERGESRIRPRVVCTSAEVLDLETRQHIKTAFGAPVLNLYSSMEFGNIAWQCPHCGAMHINADSFVVEVVSQDGTPVAPGEIGTLVCTDFNSHAMPFIRYAVGDMGTPTEAVVASGHPCPRYVFPTMGPVQGRIVDRVRRPDGVVISPYQFTCSLELVPGVAQYQVCQETLDRVIVRVVPGRDFVQPDATGELLARCREILGVDVAVTVQVVDAIPREPSGKFRVVKSEI
ncbi:MAG: phenylacetate--CoA ligase family protein [Anaerolineae bacterium]|nr:phenylacetate--CoA ligase family protein [Anaerolineae bacterium]